MTWKTLAAAAVLALGLTPSVASADPAILEALIKSRASANAAVVGGMNAFFAPDIRNTSATVPTGWNFFHCGQNGWFFDGTNQWYYLFTIEGGALWFEINNVSAGIGLLSSCTFAVTNNLGNNAVRPWQGVFVVNGSTGAFNETGNWWFY